ncbi:MAG: DUF4209 domain-containing protein [Chloroflexi bacterium]|nr:DUF4209 domain-containing protein [Chloroflexota bacterium]
MSNTLLTLDDFNSLDWLSVIAACPKKDCSTYADAFSSKAKEADSNGDEVAQEVFTLMSAITSLYLRPDDSDRPFSPAIPEDIPDHILDVLLKLAPSVADPEMRARITDLLWVRRHDYHMGILAVDAYIQAATVLEDPDTWPPCAERIARAVNLAALLGPKNPPFLTAIRYVESVLDKYNGDDPLFLSAQLMQLLQRYRQGDPTKYAALSEKAARQAEKETNWYRAKTYWEIALIWHRINGDADQERNMRINAAETLVKEAESALTRVPPGYGVAAHWIQIAIQEYRAIGGVRERIQELRHLMLDYEQKSLSEFQSFQIPVDLGEPARQARDKVRGKPLQEAFQALSKLRTSPDLKDLRKEVEDLAKQFPMQFIFTSSTYGAGGKVISQRASVLSENNSESDDAIRIEMHRLAALDRAIFSAGVIEPARRLIVEEHPEIKPDDFLPILTDNPFIPDDRILIYAKGLAAGLQGDLLVAAHLLVPQLESSLRLVLSQRGVITSSLDENGIQEEYDLKRLLYLPEILPIFGDNLTFELRGLLVDQAGTNLRNRLAHGLISHDAFYSEDTIYTWWLTFRLCVIFKWMQENPQGSDHENTSSETTDKQEPGQES